MDTVMQTHETYGVFAVKADVFHFIINFAPARAVQH